MHVLTIQGYSYVAQAAAARAEVIAALAHAEEATAAGRDPGFAQIIVLDRGVQVGDQMDDLHRTMWGACSCGWMVEDARELGGHLDLRTSMLAETFVLVDGENLVAVGCQRCGVVTNHEDVSIARTEQRSHRCLPRG